MARVSKQLISLHCFLSCIRRYVRVCCFSGAIKREAASEVDASAVAADRGMPLLVVFVVILCIDVALLAFYVVFADVRMAAVAFVFF